MKRFPSPSYPLELPAGATRHPLEQQLTAGRNILSSFEGRVVCIGFGGMASALVAALVDLYKVRKGENERITA